MNPKLLPCPFCSGDAELLVGEGILTGQIFVYCKKCQASQNIWQESVTAAVSKWNARPVIA